MPAIAPFAPLRFTATDSQIDPGAVIAPPYDVISPAQRLALLASDPHNVIQLILPEGDGDAKYAAAGEVYRRWINEGVLVREQEPGLYPYTQTFRNPNDGTSVTRTGFICSLGLVPFSEGSVLPHERTLSGPKADRLKLMQATDANLEPIFGMYSDPDEASIERLRAIATSDTPMLDVTDPDGVRHQLWRTTDPATVAAFVDDLQASNIFIVDGHHRYETALNYREMMGEGTGRDGIMIFLAPSSDPGLLILPTHRVVRDLPAFSFEALLAELEPNFSLTEYPDRASGHAALAATEPDIAYLLLRGDRTLLVRLRDGTDPATLVGTDVPTALATLDVTILHDYIFEKLLDMSRSSQADQQNLDYIKNTPDAFSAADLPTTEMVAMMNPPRLDQVESVASSGGVMPQKSTYFYPKLASGLLINDLGGAG